MYLWYLYKTAVKIETNDEAYAHMYIYIHFFEKKSYSYILLYHIAFQRLMTNNTTKTLIVIRQIFIVSLLQNLKWNKNGNGKKMLTINNHFVSVICDTTCRAGETIIAGKLRGIRDTLEKILIPISWWTVNCISQKPGTLHNQWRQRTKWTFNSYLIISTKTTERLSNTVFAIQTDLTIL